MLLYGHQLDHFTYLCWKTLKWMKGTAESVKQMMRIHHYKQNLSLYTKPCDIVNMKYWRAPIPPTLAAKAAHSDLPLFIPRKYV